MISLLLAIVCATGNHLIFRTFEKFRINLVFAIAANYATCVCIGLLSAKTDLSVPRIVSQPWYLFSIIQGIFLFVCFYLIGRTTRHHGVAVAGLATRLSVAVPTLAAFYLYADTAGPYKIFGIFLALSALGLSCIRSGTQPARREQKLLLLPVWLFLAFGGHATLIKLVQEQYLGDASYHVYIMASFFTAFITAFTAAWFHAKRMSAKPRAKDILAGICLGSANYGALYFLIRTLGLSGWQSSQIFPTISIAVVISSALGAFVFFKERLRKNLLAAIGIGIVSILLINL